MTKLARVYNIEDELRESENAIEIPNIHKG